MPSCAAAAVVCRSCFLDHLLDGKPVESIEGVHLVPPRCRYSFPFSVIRVRRKIVIDGLFPFSPAHVTVCFIFFYICWIELPLTGNSILNDFSHFFLVTCFIQFAEFGHVSIPNIIEVGRCAQNHLRQIFALYII